VEPLLKDPFQPALPHALPFRVVFEEHRRRREAKLLEHAANVFGCKPSDALNALTGAIRVQENTYARLADATGNDNTAIGDCQRAEMPLKALLHAMNSSALCLSGGGIRSASYSLGVLEGLSRFSQQDPNNGLMHKLDYLSTVSGGGYIGSWLSSWIYRRKEAMECDAKVAYAGVIAAMAGQSAKIPLTSGDPEPQPVRHLRSYTSFLAPELGLTLDTFTLAAIYMRNLLVNWTMLVPLLIAAIAATQVLGYLTIRMHHLVGQWTAIASDRVAAQMLFGAIAGLLFLVAAIIAGVSLPSHSSNNPANKDKSGAWWFVGLVLAGSWALTVAQRPGNGSWLGPVVTGVVGVVGYLILGIWIWETYRRRSEAAEDAGKVGAANAFVLSIVVSLVIGILASGILMGIQKLSSQAMIAIMAHPNLSHLALEGRLYLVFALPLTTTAIMVATSLFCALLGLLEMEEDREWWARCGGALLYGNLMWMVAQTIAFYGNGAGHRLVAGFAGLALGAMGSAVGFSGATTAGPRPVKEAQLSKLGEFLVKHNLVLPAVGGAALCLIALGMTALEEMLRSLVLEMFRWLWHLHLLTFLRTGLAKHPWNLHVFDGLASSAILLLISSGLAWLVNEAININIFSLHGMYRMRLMRAFLGASNTLRRPDPFTNFDPKDTPHESDLPACEGVPLHVINTTLNLTGTTDPAWRQRKAESFTFSPIQCGGWRVGYVPANIYGGTRGVTLATAMSISGAAFNPNMGYQSSPVLSLLMTFFNLRLGFWLPNPKSLSELPTIKDTELPSGLTDDKRKKHVEKQQLKAVKEEKKVREFLHESGPSFSLRPLLEEAFGLANDTRRWIELTDGGHFENLGLYEMVLRRCKQIVVVDAGADPKFQFEDLGNAIRKIEIDLGVPVRFPPNMNMKAGMKKKNSYCAVATIEYSCVDAVEGMTLDQCEALNGHLVYIKAGLTGEEPVDIVQYALTHPAFPHESTGNQFFTESQFESYRHLGSFAVSCIQKMPKNKLLPGASLLDFYDRAEKLWQKRETLRSAPAANTSLPLP
jgi:hypothetical protein